MVPEPPPPPVSPNVIGLRFVDGGQAVVISLIRIEHPQQNGPQASTVFDSQPLPLRQ
jgi:hypothetical protein